jgi:hypothetical protein
MAPVMTETTNQAAMKGLARRNASCGAGRDDPVDDTGNLRRRCADDQRIAVAEHRVAEHRREWLSQPRPHRERPPLCAGLDRIP